MLRFSRLLALVAALCWAACACAQRPVGLLVGRSASKLGEKCLERALRPLGLTLMRQASALTAAQEDKRPRLAIVRGREFSQGDVQAIAAFVRSGGKLLLLGDVDARVAEIVGLNVRGAELPSPAPTAAEIPSPPFASCPARIEQSPKILVRYGGEQAKEFGQWKTAAGEGTGLAFGVVCPKAVALSSELAPGDPDGAMQLLAAALGALDGQLLPHIAAQLLAAAGKLGRFSARGIDALDPYLRDCAQRAGREELRLAVNQALEAYDEARQLLASGEFAQVIAAAVRARKLLRAAYAATFSARQGELRAVWCHVVPERTWEEQARAIAQAGFNAIFVYTSSAAHAYYPSAVLPRAPDAPKGDPLAECLRAAAEAGLDVFAWHAVFYALDAADERAAQLRAEDRLVRNAQGQQLCWLCPSREENVKLAGDVLRELLSKYDLAGVVLDFVRLPNQAFCFCNACRERFEKQRQSAVGSWPADVSVGLLQGDFRRFLQTTLADALGALADTAHQTRPGSLVAATIFPEPERSALSVGQEWRRWLSLGKLDILCPLDYEVALERLPAVVGEQAALAGERALLCPGFEPAPPGEPPAEPAFLCEVIDAARVAGADGFALRAYSQAAQRELFPLLASGVFAQRTVPPYRGPRVRWEFVGQPLPKVQPRLFSAAAEVRAKVSLEGKGPLVAYFEPLVGGAPERKFNLPEQGGEVVARLPEGRYRLAIAPAGAAGPHWVARSPVIEVANERRIAELKAAAERAARIDVGIFEGARGSRSLWQELSRYRSEGIAVAWVREISEEALRPLDVLVLSDPPERQKFTLEAVRALRAWVAAGKGVLALHEAVRLGPGQALFPQIADPSRGGRSNAPEVKVLPARHPMLERFTPGHRFRLAYADHIWMEPGGFGTALVADALDETHAVVVAGNYLDGRVVLCGLAMGFSQRGEVPIAPAERNILIAAVRWLGGARPARPGASAPGAP